MDRIILHQDDIQFIFDWKDKNRDKIHYNFKIPIKALKIEMVDQNIVITAIADYVEHDNEIKPKLTLSVTHMGRSAGKIKGYLVKNEYGKQYIAIHKKSNLDITKIIPAKLLGTIYKNQLPTKKMSQKELQTACNDLYAKDIITLWATLMCLFIHGATVVRHENLTKDVIQKESVPNRKTNKATKPKHGQKESITYILSRNKKNEISLKARFSHKKPTESFSVRGHFRHYKNGKVVWINAYIKNKDKRLHKDKTYKL